MLSATRFSSQCSQRTFAAATATMQTSLLRAGAPYRAAMPMWMTIQRRQRSAGAVPPRQDEADAPHPAPSPQAAVKQLLDNVSNLALRATPPSPGVGTRISTTTPTPPHTPAAPTRNSVISSRKLIRSRKLQRTAAPPSSRPVPAATAAPDAHPPSTVPGAAPEPETPKPSDAAAMPAQEAPLPAATAAPDAHPPSTAPGAAPEPETPKPSDAAAMPAQEAAPRLFRNPMEDLADRPDAVHVSLRGSCYVDSALKQLLLQAEAAEGYDCPVWATLESLQRHGMELCGTPRPVTAVLSSGESVTLYNVEDTTFFAQLRAKLAGEDGGAAAVPTTGNAWAAAVLAAVRERSGASHRALGEQQRRQKEEEAVAAWHAVPRNILGKPLRGAVLQALRDGHPGLEALQRVSPVWIEAGHARVLGLHALPGEEEKGFAVPFSGRVSSDGAAAELRAPQVWYHASQMAAHPRVDLSFAALHQDSLPQFCLNAEGKQYGVATTFLLRSYCRQHGLDSSRWAVFITPERLRQRGGAVKGETNGAEGSSNSAPCAAPFTMIAGGEVLTLWHAAQTTLHRVLIDEAMAARQAHMELRPRQSGTPRPSATAAGAAPATPATHAAPIVGSTAGLSN